MVSSCNAEYWIMIIEHAEGGNHGHDVLLVAKYTCILPCTTYIRTKFVRSTAGYERSLFNPLSAPFSKPGPVPPAIFLRDKNANKNP